MKLGLEAEYWVVDAEGGLTDGRDLTSAHEHATPEFVDSLIEVQTPPVETTTALARELREVIATVSEAAADTQRHLVPLGTPLTAQSGAITTQRGRLLERMYGDGIQPAINCAGTHIHFDQGHVEDQLNTLTALDPALALVNSSPYYRGERLADSSRAYAYRLLSGVRFTRHRDLWAYTADREEWNRNLVKRYEELRAVATECEIADEAFETHFEPENAVLTPVRLRTHSPTVEWRAPDTALPSQVVRLAGDVLEILERTTHAAVEIADLGTDLDAFGASDTRISIPAFEDLRELSRRAIRSGLGSPAVREYLESMGFDPTAYRPLSARIEDSMEREDTTRISETDARDVRLGYADALQADLTRL